LPISQALRTAKIFLDSALLNSLKRMNESITNAPPRIDKKLKNKKRKEKRKDIKMN
jgi:hypothetical protein